MNAAYLIADLQARGIRLIPNPPKLAVEPASKLTDDDCAAIRAHKAELLRLLTGAHPVTPKESLIGTCRKYGVALTVDPNGTLVIDYARAWPTLLQALAAHADAIAALLLTAADGQRIALRRVEA
jgi:hypothetical protein